ncbi:uncharacterized protein LOC120889133 [Ictidomys tridecemlineatus]
MLKAPTSPGKFSSASNTRKVSGQRKPLLSHAQQGAVGLFGRPARTRQRSLSALRVRFAGLRASIHSTATLWDRLPDDAKVTASSYEYRARKGREILLPLPHDPLQLSSALPFGVFFLLPLEPLPLSGAQTRFPRDSFRSPRSPFGPWHSYSDPGGWPRPRKFRPRSLQKSLSRDDLAVLFPSRCREKA